MIRYIFKTSSLFHLFVTSALLSPIKHWGFLGLTRYLGIHKVNLWIPFIVGIIRILIIIFARLYLCPCFCKSCSIWWWHDDDQEEQVPESLGTGQRKTISAATPWIRNSETWFTLIFLPLFLPQYILCRYLISWCHRISDSNCSLSQCITSPIRALESRINGVYY